MTLYRKAEITFDIFGVLMAMAFVVTCGYCYKEYRQPELGAFIDQKIEQYEAEKPKPVILWRERRPHFFQYSIKESDNPTEDLFKTCDAKCTKLGNKGESEYRKSHRAQYAQFARN